MSGSSVFPAGPRACAPVEKPPLQSSTLGGWVVIQAGIRAYFLRVHGREKEGDQAALVRGLEQKDGGCGVSLQRVEQLQVKCVGTVGAVTCQVQNSVLHTHLTGCPLNLVFTTAGQVGKKNTILCPRSPCSHLEEAAVTLS